MAHIKVQKEIAGRMMTLETGKIAKQAHGAVTVTYGDGSEESVKGGDLFYWPPGHSIRVGEDAEIVLFSPQHEHTDVMDHINAKLAG